MQEFSRDRWFSVRGLLLTGDGIEPFQRFMRYLSTD